MFLIHISMFQIKAKTNIYLHFNIQIKVIKIYIIFDAKIKAVKQPLLYKHNKKYEDHNYIAEKKLIQKI